MFRAIYTFLSYVSAPFVFLYLIVRGLRDPSYRERRIERFGFTPPDISANGIWIHTVSAGEALAAVPIVEFLLSTYTDCSVLVTATTPAGSNEIVKRFGAQVEHCYAPYDFPWAVRRFLSQAKPKALFLMETELWPNLVRVTSRNDVPVFLVNARLSDKSAQGYSRLGDLTSSTLSAIQGIACQYEDTAQRFAQLGVPLQKIQVTGSVKFDVGSPPPLPTGLQEKMEILGTASDHVWIAGSTHSGEEEIALVAHGNIRSSLEDATLILAPRHTNRCAEVMELCKHHGFRVSTLDGDLDKVDVVLVDQMGILFAIYGFARVAFIGGSLQGTGGHNPIEAAVHGVPIVMGPDRHNFEEICRRFKQSRCLNDIGNANELAVTVRRLLADETEWTRQSRCVREVVADNQGALTKLKSTISDWLGDDPISRTEN